MKECMGLLLIPTFGMWSLLILIDHPLICVIAYLVHKSWIPYLVFHLLIQQCY
jgi:hypothetical protein